MQSVIFGGLLMGVINVVCSLPMERTFPKIPPLSDDVIYGLPTLSLTNEAGVMKLDTLKRLWLTHGGKTFPDKARGRLEVAATPKVTAKAHKVGASIISSMTIRMPDAVFARLASKASVGLFTKKENVTVFPEYKKHYRPGCVGSCLSQCSVTCTKDRRKYDSLAGLGGPRAACLDENFMCQKGDPFHGKYSVLVHEFGHTVHMMGLSNGYKDKVEKAYENARKNRIWDTNSYAMSNSYEYFAEGAGVFFNTNNHPSSCGKMNRCGHQSGFCQSETEGRQWLKRKDPMLYDVLSYAYTNNRPHLKSNLKVCVHQ